MYIVTDLMAAQISIIFSILNVLNRMLLRQVPGLKTQW